MLIRALEPTDGIEAMRERRRVRSDLDLCSGPGKLTQALGIDLSDNERDLCREPFLLTEPEGERPEIVVGPRIGITKAVENPWRFCAADNRNVSRPWPSRPRTRSGGGGA